MEQTAGYVALGESSKVSHLRKVIYCLKQSPQAWFANFGGLLKTFGFTPCQVDLTMLTKRTLTGSDTVGIQTTKAYLQQHLSLRDLGTPRNHVKFIGQKLYEYLLTSIVHLGEGFFIEDIITFASKLIQMYHMQLTQGIKNPRLAITAAPKPMPMHYDNQAAIFIAKKEVFHEQTKHIEGDCHYIRDKVMAVIILTPFVASSQQLVDVFTKSLLGISKDGISTKLGMFDLYAPFVQVKQALVWIYVSGL
ncbi:uncharacterized protein LOC144704503 [Wolffia australiana]